MASHHRCHRWRSCYQLRRTSCHYGPAHAADSERRQPADNQSVAFRATVREMERYQCYPAEMTETESKQAGNTEPNAKTGRGELAVKIIVPILCVILGWGLKYLSDQRSNRIRNLAYFA